MIATGLGWSLKDVAGRLLEARYSRIRLKSEHPRGFFYYAQGTDPAAAEAGTAEVLAKNFEPHAGRVTSLFRRLPVGVRWQVLQSYIELVVYNMLGKRELVAFVRGCVL